MAAAQSHYQPESLRNQQLLLSLRPCANIGS